MLNPVVNQGLSGLSGLIDPPTSNNPLATDALTPTAQWFPGNSYADLNNQSRFAVKVEAEITSLASDGLLLEFGGGGLGTVLYIHNGSIYATGGKGRNQNFGTDAIEVSWPIPSPGTYLVELAGVSDAVTGTMRLYIDGVSVSTGTATALSNFSGSTGAVAGSTSGVATTRMATDNTPFSGNFISAHVYANQAPADLVAIAS